MENKYTIKQVSTLDKEIRKLSSLYSETRIRVGLELAERLYKIEQNKLYLRLDGKAYPNFNRYIQSLGQNYKSVRELIGLYQTYVLVAGYSVKELSEIPYHVLTIWKPYCFSKENSRYKLIKSKREVNNVIKSAVNLSLEDNKQLRRENEVGEHKHEFYRITYDICEICKLKEFHGKIRI